MPPKRKLGPDGQPRKVGRPRKEHKEESLVLHLRRVFHSNDQEGAKNDAPKEKEMHDQGSTLALLEILFDDLEEEKREARRFREQTFARFDKIDAVLNSLLTKQEVREGVGREPRIPVHSPPRGKEAGATGFAKHYSLGNVENDELHPNFFDRKWKGKEHAEVDAIRDYVWGKPNAQRQLFFEEMQLPPAPKDIPPASAVRELSPSISAELPFEIEKTRWLYDDEGWPIEVRKTKEEVLQEIQRATAMRKDNRDIQQVNNINLVESSEEEDPEEEPPEPARSAESGIYDATARDPNRGPGR